jgi:polar amino acid transport system substrate-binding protein
MNRLRFRTVLGILLLLVANTGRAALPSVISVCDDGAEWPPYTYYKRVDGARTNVLTGFSVEYLQRVLDRKGLRFTLELIPWKRCMAEVINGHYAMLLNASLNPERARDFLVTMPYYALTLVYFYDADRPRPTVNSAADLRTLHSCGVSGYNYAPFELEPDMIDTNAKDLPQAFLKLKRGHCDVVPDRLEVAIGYEAIGMLDLKAEGIRYALVPNLPRSPFFMMVSRNVPYANELLAVLNEGIAAIEASHEAYHLAAKYGLPQAGPLKR